MIELADCRATFDATVARMKAEREELVEALRKIAEWQPDASPEEPMGLSIMEAIDIAKSALAKAEGRQG